MRINFELPKTIIFNCIKPKIDSFFTRVDFKNRIFLFRESSKQLNQYLVKRLDEWDNKLDEVLPNFEFQKKLDVLGEHIQKQFAPLTEFNKILVNNGYDKWYQRLALSLCRFSMQAALDIIKLIYTTIKNICYGIVHPLKAVNAFVKQFIILIDQLQKTENWAKVGVSMIGASVGQVLPIRNPISLFGFGIGCAMLVGGLTIETIKDVLRTTREDTRQVIKESIQNQLNELPESMITSFWMGLVVGGIQRAITDYRLNALRHRLENYNETKERISLIEWEEIPVYLRTKVVRDDAALLAGLNQLSPSRKKQ